MNIESSSLHLNFRQSDSASYLDPKRVRSMGVLSSAEVASCRANGVELAFDPVQIGWVTLDCSDDFEKSGTAETQLVFRPWDETDAPALAALLSDERLWQHLPEEFPGVLDNEAARDLIALGAEEHHHVRAAVENGVPVGQVRLLYSGPGEAEISYWLGVAHWGKGLGRRLVSQFTEECLAEQQHLSRLFARVHENNTASRRVIEAAGYVEAGRDGVWLIFERRRAS